MVISSIVQFVSPPLSQFGTFLTPGFFQASLSVRSVTGELYRGGKYDRNLTNCRNSKAPSSGEEGIQNQLPGALTVPPIASWVVEKGKPAFGSRRGRTEAAVSTGATGKPRRAL